MHLLSDTKYNIHVRLSEHNETVVKSSFVSLISSWMQEQSLRRQLDRDAWGTFRLIAPLFSSGVRYFVLDGNPDDFRDDRHRIN